MLVCAIDIALACSGLVVLSGDGKLLHTELIKPPNKQPYFQKILYLYNILNLTYQDIRGRFGKTPYLVLEGRLEGGFSAKTLASLEGARIAAFLAYVHVNGPDSLERVFLYSPATVKKFLTGKRSADKKQMAETFVQKFGDTYAVRQHDLIDAVCLGLVFLSEQLGGPGD